ncbi:stimulator of interferon genes protein [Ceratina calcarata]|uniref:Stimulator of interferon genes protein n=1 Tax=Ceratina calcarata TaxID=156304 RepID=A0AAJ7WAK7_9HYME|nr:stimulator of interferon genes protein [Ceratina calcarata]
MNRDAGLFTIFCSITGILIKLHLESKDLAYIIAYCMTVTMFMTLFMNLYEHIFKKYFSSETSIIKTTMKTEKKCDLDSMRGLDCGTHMAHLYYNGYLRIILPSPGTTTKGLIEKIEDYEDINNIQICVHKLFILIPSSSYIPPDLVDASNKWMEGTMDLSNEVRNRGGVKRREYHNTVYKIYPDGQKTNAPLYLVVEGASPLVTLYEMTTRAHAETEVYRSHSKDIIRKFYEKLKDLLDNDPECANTYELIYYDDDKNGNKVNVAKVILDRLAENRV